MTVLEVSNKKTETTDRDSRQPGEKRPFKVMDRSRLTRKGIMAASLQDLLRTGA